MMLPAVAANCPRTFSMYSMYLYAVDCVALSRAASNFYDPPWVK